MAIRFLDVDRVRQIHLDQIRRYGGSEGVRDPGALESALAQPTASFGGAYLHQDLFDMAAAYLYHLVENHAFIDGNKRVGAMTAFVFLMFNGYRLIAEEQAFEDLTLAVARGETKKPEIAAFFRANVEKVG